MTKRINVYFNEETLQKFSEIRNYLEEEMGGSLNRQSPNHSATVVKVIHAFHKLFLESGEKQPFAERLSRLEKNLANSDEQKILKSIRHQMDQLLYLELTNFMHSRKEISLTFKIWSPFTLILIQSKMN